MIETVRRMPSSDLKCIIFLSGEAEASALGEVLTSHNPGLEIRNAPSRKVLDHLCQNLQPGTRLISFCSPVIVPATYLAAIDCGSYNFHPGPPSYPGRYPSVFALYESAKNFGITVHEMVERVDEGSIVAAEWFQIPDSCDLETLDTLAFKALLDEFRRLAQQLATDSSRFRTKPIGWSGTKRSKADCDALCTLNSNLPKDEQAKRMRACGPHLRSAH